MNDNIFTRARSVGIESVLEKVVEHFNVFGLPNHIQLWLDNDDAGRNATIFLTEKLQCDIEDMSSVYASYNDVNDWLVATK